MLQLSRTSDILLRSGLSLDNSYYLFCGSYADKWIIASMLGHLFDHDAKAFIIASNDDKELLRIFLGERINRVHWADQKIALQIRHGCHSDPNSYMPPAESAIIIRASPQRGCIRSLHLVDYPYFTELSASRYIRYLDLQRTIMHIPRDAKMAMPSYLNSVDEKFAETLLSDANLLNCKSAIINPVNFSHRQLSMEGLCAISGLLQRQGYTVGFNIAQSTDPEMGSSLNARTSASILSMPGHLMKTIYDKISLCVGAYGGAMTIADGFGACSVFSIFTPALFFPAVNFGPDCHDFEKFWAEPRPSKPRLSRGSSFLSGTPLQEVELIEKELGDLLNQLESL